MKRYQGLILFSLLLFVLTGGLIYCGGGGGDEECVDSIITGVYQYQFFTNDLTVQAGTGTLSINFNNFAGSYNSGTDAFSVDQSSRIDATGTGTFPSFIATVTQALQLPSDANPTAGQFEVTVGADKITVTVDNSIPGVKVELDTGNNGNIDDTQNIPWTDFKDDNTAIPLYARQAALVFGSGKFIIEQIDLVLAAGDVIDLNEFSFLENVAFPVPCDPFSPLTPPPGVSNQGDSTFTWSDSVDDNEINSGDDFQVVFNQCWDDDSSDSEDLLINGTVNLNDISISGTDDNCRLVGFGFDDVQYVNLILSDTITSGGTVTIDSDTTVNGSFSINFFIIIP